MRKPIEIVYWYKIQIVLEHNIFTVSKNLHCHTTPIFLYFNRPRVACEITDTRNYDICISQKGGTQFELKFLGQNHNKVDTFASRVTSKLSL